jgi:hypothetical protein
MPLLHTAVEVVVLQPPEDERRKAPRYPSGRLSLVRAGRGGDPVARRAVIRDISASGVRVDVDCEYPRGTSLAVAPLGWPGPRVLVVRVVRSWPEGEGWAHGCEFVEPLGESELFHWRKGP